MYNTRTNNELFNQAKSILLQEGKVRISTIQIKCELGFVKAKTIFDALVKIDKSGLDWMVACARMTSKLLSLFFNIAPTIVKHNLK